MWTNVWRKCCFLLLWLYCCTILRWCSQLRIFDETGANFSFCKLQPLHIQKRFPSKQMRQQNKNTRHLCHRHPYPKLFQKLIKAMLGFWNHITSTPSPHLSTNSLFEMDFSIILKKYNELNKNHHLFYAAWGNRLRIISFEFKNLENLELQIWTLVISWSQPGILARQLANSKRPRLQDILLQNSGSKRILQGIFRVLHFQNLV